jgi:phage-related minor tail protein
VTTQALNIEVSASTSGLLTAMMEAGNMTERQAQRMLGSIKSLDATIKSWEKSQVMAADSAGTAIAASAANMDRYNATSREARVEANMLRQANRQLSMQMTDIFTSLAGGMPAHLVLIQQGGQIKDAYGGILPALRAILGMVTPLNAALAASAAVMGGVAAAYYLGAKQAAELRDTLALTGNAAGLTEDRMRMLASRVADASQQTVGSTRDILLALAATGQTSSAVIESQGRAVARISDLSGKAGKEVAAGFASQLEAPTKFAAKLNESYNFLTVAEYRRIKALADQSRNADAAVLTNDLLTKALDRQREQLGTIESAWEAVTKAISRAKEAALNIGKPDTLQDQIADQLKQLQFLQGQLERNKTIGRGEAGIAGLGSLNDGLRAQIAAAQQRLRELQRQTDIESTNADARSAQAAQVRKVVADDQKQEGAGKSFLEQLKRQVEEQQRGRTEMLLLEAAQKGVLAAAKPYIFQLEEMESRQRRIKRLVEEAAEEETQRAKVSGLVKAGDTAAVNYIRQAQDIGQTAEALERLNLQRQLEADLATSLVGADAATRGELYMIFARNVANATAALDAFQAKRQEFSGGKFLEDLVGQNKKAGAGLIRDERERGLALIEIDRQQSLKRLAEQQMTDEQRAQARTLIDQRTQLSMQELDSQIAKSEQLFNGSMQRMEDAIVNFAKTGKLSFSDLFGFMAEEYIRNIIRMAMQSTLMNSTGGFIGWGAMFSGIGKFFGFPLAEGIDYVPYDGFPAILHKGERVQTAIEARGGGSGGPGNSVSFDYSGQVLNVGQGVSRAEVSAALARNNAEMQMQIRRQMREGVLS